MDWILSKKKMEGIFKVIFFIFVGTLSLLLLYESMSCRGIEKR